MAELIPEWVRKRDGRLVPFEADRISQSLFAVTESLGQPNAFLARELTDAILHYLPEEVSGGVGETTATTAQVAEVIVKVVRELGHPHLARLYEEYRQQTPRKLTSPTGPFQPSRASRAPELTLQLPLETPLKEVLRAATRQYTLQAVYSRDIVALHLDGLLQIQDLETPDQLASIVLGNLEAVQTSRGWPARLVALDGPDHWFSVADQGLSDLVTALHDGVSQAGVEAIVNLNLAIPPAGTSQLARGPLFANPPVVGSVGREEIATKLLDQLRGQADRIAIHWHLGEQDFTESASGRLMRPAREVIAGRRLLFVFDRPRKPIALGMGLTRTNPAVLLGLHLDLALLAEQTNTAKNYEQFLRKLGSLGRLALSAGVQKRAYLRREQRHPQLSTGFLLDRARLRLVPLGLDRLIQENLSRTMESGGAALELGRKVLHAFGETIRKDGKAARLETCQDGETRLHPQPPMEELAPLWKQHWRIANNLHTASDLSTLCLPLPTGTTPIQVTEIVRLLWQQTDLVRVQFEKPPENPGEKLLQTPLH